MQHAHEDTFGALNVGFWTIRMSRCHRASESCFPVEEWSRGTLIVESIAFTLIAALRQVITNGLMQQIMSHRIGRNGSIRLSNQWRQHIVCCAQEFLLDFSDEVRREG